MHAYSALLDQLLGPDRNELPSASGLRRRRAFDDPAVCRYFLLDFCPYDLFVNTRAHMGPCPKLHDDGMKAEFDKLRAKAKDMKKDLGRESGLGRECGVRRESGLLGENAEVLECDRCEALFEADMAECLKNLIGQAEQKIEKANRRIDAPLPETSLLTPEQQTSIDEMNTEITNLLQQAEVAGERGGVEEVAQITRQVQQLKKEIEKTQSAVYGAYIQREKSLRVCVVCGAMQSVGDSMSRFESHVTGKLHIGFEKIRSWINEHNLKSENLAAVNQGGGHNYNNQPHTYNTRPENYNTRPDTNVTRGGDTINTRGGGDITNARGDGNNNISHTARSDDSFSHPHTAGGSSHAGAYAGGGGLNHHSHGSSGNSQNSSYNAAPPHAMNAAPTHPHAGGPHTATHPTRLYNGEEEEDDDDLPSETSRGESRFYDRTRPPRRTNGPPRHPGGGGPYNNLGGAGYRTGDKIGSENRGSERTSIDRYNPDRKRPPPPPRPPVNDESEQEEGEV